MFYNVKKKSWWYVYRGKLDIEKQNTSEWERRRLWGHIYTYELLVLCTDFKFPGFLGFKYFK